MELLLFTDILWTAEAPSLIKISRIRVKTRTASNLPKLSGNDYKMFFKRREHQRELIFPDRS